MLSCLVGKKLINTIDYNHDDIRKWSNKGILKCPVCEGEMIFRKGYIKIPHFVHKDSCVEDKGFWENETKEHHLGKQYLYRWLSNQYGVENLILEAWISETRQRPDLMFELFGEKYAIEYQCSNITLEQFLDREKLYQLNGIKSIWILGTENFNKKRRKAIEEYLFENQKRVHYLDSINEVFTKSLNIKNMKHPFKYITTNSTDLFIDTCKEIKSTDEISDDFNSNLRNFIKQCEDNEKRNYNSLLRYQKELYQKLYSEFTTELDIKQTMKLSESKESKPQIMKKEVKTKIFECNSCEYQSAGFCTNYKRWCSVIKDHRFNENDYPREINEKCILRREIS